MSVINLVKDVLAGNFTNAAHRVKDWWTNSAPQWLKNVITTVETKEGKILQTLLPIAAQDVIAGGFSTDSFVKAAKDIGAALAKQNITMANTVIFTALNGEVFNISTAEGIEVPTNTGSAVVPAPVVPSGA